MRKMLNTLYVTSSDSFLMLENENVSIEIDGERKGQIPLLNLESIITFGYKGATPALMGECAKRGISLCFFTQNGRFLARVCGESRGNILLRHEQYRIADSEICSAEYARDFLIGKLHNSRAVLNRAMRDHPMRIDAKRVEGSVFAIENCLDMLKAASPDLETLRGIEGKAAQAYFTAFDELILQQKSDFKFTTRTRRPPLDRINTLLSFFYTLLANDVASALESVGLDPYEGFMHRERPGRKSLALDLMEELRPIIADRLALSLVNLKQVAPDDFIIKGNGSTIMTDECRKRVIKAWQERKTEEVEHPFLCQKMPRGLIVFAQAQILARRIRGDTDRYPPYFWR